jgi:hypothetical protein
MRAREFIAESSLGVVAYHGTNNKFSSFDNATLGTSTGDPNAVLGHFFTTSIREAKLYGKYIISASLTMNKTYEATMDELVGLEKEDYLELREELIADGYDSIIAEHDEGDDVWYVVFSTNQIKFLDLK